PAARGLAGARQLLAVDRACGRLVQHAPARVVQGLAEVPLVRVHQQARGTATQIVDRAAAHEHPARQGATHLASPVRLASGGAGHEQLAPVCVDDAVGEAHGGRTLACPPCRTCPTSSSTTWRWPSTRSRPPCRCSATPWAANT